MRISLTIAFVFLLALSAMPASAANFEVDLFGGASVHANMAMQIGNYRIDDPQWESRPWSSPMYYSIRGRWSGGEIELLHDKVYMGHDTAGVSGFNMSDGYNMLLYNFLGGRAGWETRFGVGALIVHPEGKVGGIHIGSHGDRHFRFGGIGAQAALGYRLSLQNSFSLIAEGKLTAGYTRLHIADVGELTAPVIGIHLLLGIGYKL